MAGAQDVSVPNRTWFQLQPFDTCFYTLELHQADPLTYPDLAPSMPIKLSWGAFVGGGGGGALSLHIVVSEMHSPLESAQYNPQPGNLLTSVEKWQRGKARKPHPHEALLSPSRTLSEILGPHGRDKLQ